MKTLSAATQTTMWSRAQTGGKKAVEIKGRKIPLVGGICVSLEASFYECTHVRFVVRFHDGKDSARSHRHTQQRTQQTGTRAHYGRTTRVRDIVSKTGRRSVKFLLHVQTVVDVFVDNFHTFNVNMRTRYDVLLCC